MIRKLLCTLVAAGALVVASGCDNASSTAAKAKDTAKDVAKDVKDGAKDVAKGTADMGKEVGKDVKDVAKGAIDAGKEGLTKISEFATKEYPAIETKINGLSGDAKTKATEAFAALKKAVEDAKAFVADPAKMKAAWEDITAKLAALKKQIGL